MKRLVLTFGMLCLFSVARAGEFVVNAGGKDVTVQYRVLNREITEKDLNTGNQASAEECSFLYYSLLAKGDIRGAAQLDVNPAAAAASATQYRERLGADDFRREMAAYFTSKSVFIAELALADESMLVLRTPDYTAGQLYRKKNGKYFVLSGMPLSETSKALGKALGLIKEGKIKLQ